MLLVYEMFMSVMLSTRIQTSRKWKSPKYKIKAYHDDEKKRKQNMKRVERATIENNVQLTYQLLMKSPATRQAKANGELEKHGARNINRTASSANLKW